VGWDLGDGVHEGWAAQVVPDGRLSASSSGEGVLVQGVTGRYRRDELMRDYEIVPDAEVIGWRGACTCGWQGALWTRVGSAAEEDLPRRRAYIPASGFSDPSATVEEAIGEEWRAHAVPVTLVADVRAAARGYARAGERLTASVAAAKAAGATWADIGAAVGITRQAAHERWKDNEETAGVQKMDAALGLEKSLRHRPSGHQG
jgi:hypothetical protein